MSGGWKFGVRLKVKCRALRRFALYLPKKGLRQQVQQLDRAFVVVRAIGPLLLLLCRVVDKLLGALILLRLHLRRSRLAVLQYVAADGAILGLDDDRRVAPRLGPEIAPVRLVVVVGRQLGRYRLLHNLFRILRLRAPRRRAEHRAQHYSPDFCTQLHLSP